MAICSSCGNKHRRWRNKARTKPAAYCSKCHAEYMKTVRERYLENITVLISVLCPECQSIISRKLSSRSHKSKMFHGTHPHRRNNVRR